MVNKTFILINCLILNACYLKNDKSLLSVGSFEQDSIFYLDTTYIRLPLLNPLLNYIKDYDTIRSSWKISPIYLVRFYFEGNDTLIYISGHKVRPDVLPQDNINMEFKGGFFIKDIPVLVFDSAIGLGSDFYFKKHLSDIVESVDKGRDWYIYETKTLPTWIFKVNSQRNINLIKIEEGEILK